MSLEKTASVSAMGFKTSRAKVQESGWGNLAAGIIDGIVNILKGWNRWKLDSPALRRVNKHWSQQISQHMIAIHPCWARVLTKQDATSLLHFPRITSLDISPFLYGFRRREANTELKEVERRLIVKAFRAELNRVIGILSQLSHLTHLDLDASLQRRQGHPFCIETCEEWSRLERITSLCAYGAHRVRQSSIPWGHRDQEPWYLDQRGEWDATQLCQLIRHFPRLRRLNARTYAFAVPPNLAELCRLESLELETGGSVEFVFAVDELPPLKALGAIAFPLNRLELARQLHHLKSLALNVQTVAELITPAFFEVMQNLRCLVLQSEVQWSRLPDDFVRTSIELESLTLSNFQLRGETLLKKLSGLTDLALHRCVLLDGYNVLDWPKSIRALSLTEVTDRQGQSMPFLSGQDVLPHICRLSLIPITEMACLKSIVQLKTLETLELGVDNDSTLAGMDELQSLPELRVLSLKVARKVSPLPTFLSLEFLTNLDALSFSGRILVAVERQKLDGIFKRSRRA